MATLWPATESIRYTAPPPRKGVLARMGPGRAQLVLEFLTLVEGAGGTVWDCDLKYGHAHVGVELPGGESHSLWPKLESLVEEMDRRCEACGEAAELRDDLLWRRTLCDEHYESISSGAQWHDVFAPWWQICLPDEPDLWPGYARSPANMTEILDSIPGAYESHRQGLEDAEEGRVTPLEDFGDESDG